MRKISTKTKRGRKKKISEFKKPIRTITKSKKKIGRKKKIVTTKKPIQRKQIHSKKIVDKIPLAVKCMPKKESFIIIVKKKILSFLKKIKYVFSIERRMVDAVLCERMYAYIAEKKLEKDLLSWVKRRMERKEKIFK